MYCIIEKKVVPLHPERYMLNPLKNKDYEEN